MDDLACFQILLGEGQSILVEGVGELSEGAEFVYTRTDGFAEAHQVKRQKGMANHWTASSLQALGVWRHAQAHVAAGREFHFVSVLPAFALRELCHRARQSEDLPNLLLSWLTNEDLNKTFTELSAESIFASPEAARAALKGIWIEWHEERNLIQVNAAVAGLLLDGARGHLAALGLGDIVMNNLGVELTFESIVAQLPSYGLSLAGGARREDLVAQVDAASDRWLASVKRELLSPAIVREEAQMLADFVGESEAKRVTFLVGAAGGGKSAVLAQGLEKVIELGIPVLGFRLDRVEGFSTTEELGDRLGLSVSPIAALAAKAGRGPCLLVVDQLDAVSLASGRMPDSFDAVADLVREAAAFPEMRVVLACRQFDVDNDHRIRSLRDSVPAESISVGELSDEELNRAVTAMGLDPSLLDPRQREVLRVPLHLVLLASVAAEPEVLSFQTTAHLFDAFWDRKRQAVRVRKRDTRFIDVIRVVATAISDTQRLSVPDTTLDIDDLAEDAKVLISEHVLVRDGHEIAFFHEAFFDYAFARQWASKSQTLVDFLIAGEQELFRRAQVRQIMHHLRGREVGRFVTDVGAALASAEIRFHIKETILSVLGGLRDPTSEELRIVLAAAQADSAVDDRVWPLLRSSAHWFARIDADGELTRWLDGPTKEERGRAVDFLAGAAQKDPDRVAEILKAQGDNPDYSEWFRRIVRYAAVHRSRALFDLLLLAVHAEIFRGHERELWLFSHNLADGNPLWAVELCRAYFAQRADASALNDSGRLIALMGRDHSAAELIAKAAAAWPSNFVEGLLPFMTDVMRVTAYSEQTGPGYPADRHFSHVYADLVSVPDIGGAMMIAMRGAVRAIVARDPVSARPILEGLAELRLASAQNLLYNGLIAAPEPYAEWAARIVLEGTDRLFCEYQSNSVWITRLLLQAIVPFIDDEQHQSLEIAVRHLRFSWENGSGGYYAFTLLSALDPARLTDIGRRCLGEYRRKFEADQPAEPTGVIGMTIQSPIPPTALPHMSDEDWIRAIEKHDADRENWMTSKGGAVELSRDLQSQTTSNPRRFASLALRLTSGHNPVYGEAILIGIAATSEALADEAVIFDCVRHIAGLGHPEIDRSLGDALRLYLKMVPMDLVELIRDRALTAANPIDDSAFSSRDEREPGGQLRMAGVNSARGRLAETLGNLIVYDVDGSRTAAVAPVLELLASDPVVSVRCQVAHTIASVLRFDRDVAVKAFWKLIDTDDSVLTAEFVRRLMMYIGNGGEAPALIPVIVRMLTSEDPKARECGGAMAVYAALEWSIQEPFDSVLKGSDSHSRKGAAAAAAGRLPASGDAELAGSVLMSMFDDPDEEVRKAAAQVVPALRGRSLQPFEGVLRGLIESRSFSATTAQVFLTLEYAPDRVDGLALRSAQRFLEVSGAAAGDMSTAAAGDSRYVSDLVVRGLAQTRDRIERSALLDVIDELIKLGAYGVEEAVESASR